MGKESNRSSTPSNVMGDDEFNNIVNGITTNFEYIQKHALYKGELAYYLDNFMKLESDRKLALIKYLAGEKGDILLRLKI